MSVVICCRCDHWQDLDVCVEGIYTDDDIPGLTKTGYDYVCENCLTQDELDRLDAIEQRGE